MALNWAIIGTGFISHQAIDGIVKSDGSQLHSIYGRNPDLAKQFQSQYGFPKLSFDVNELLSDPDVDVVYIGLPNHLHKDAAIQAAQAGKAVLSEKSLTTTMGDADALLVAVAQTRTFFVEGLMYLSHPFLSRFVEVLQDGRLGDLRSVNGYYCANIGEVVNPKGRGTLYNLGCYPTSLLQLTVQTMCGPDAFKSRQLQGFGNLNEEGNICDAACSARFGNGVLATLQSTDSYGMGNGFSVMGVNGVLSFVSNPWLPVPGRSAMMWSPYEGEVELIHVDDPFDAFFHQTKLVERHVAQGDREASRPSPRHRDSWEVMDFLTQWEASCRTALLG